MSDETSHENSTGHGSYEHRDIGIAGVLYFLLALAVAGVFVHFVVSGLYAYLDKRTEANQSPMSPLITNAPTDTRHLPDDYKDYLKQNFPAPQLEIDERNQLDSIRTTEEQTLSSYDYIDKNAGTVRIPIDRAMDLIAQRGLPVRVPINFGQSMRPVPSANTPAEQKKAKK
jgi:hypothetical protein